MTMERQQFLLVAQIETEVLDGWIEAEWLMPRIDNGQEYLSEVDVARAHLIRDMFDLGANDEAIPIILDLIDNLHGVRRSLNAVLARIQEQPEETQKRLFPLVPPA